MVYVFETYQKGLYPFRSANNTCCNRSNCSNNNANNSCKLYRTPKNCTNKKTYATLNNAFSLSIVNGGSGLFDVEANNFKTGENFYNSYLRNQLSVVKTCYNKKGCWNSGDTKNMNGSNVYYNRTGIGVGADIITAILADGTFINVDVYGSASIWTYFGTRVQNNGLVIFFDINGEKKPNTVGKDIFPLIYSEQGIVPVYRDKTQAQRDKDCSKTGTGYSCIRNYLKKM